MIELRFEEFTVLIIGGVIFFIGFLILVHSHRERSYRRKRRRQIVHCPVCNEVFDDRSNTKLPICPGCGRKTLRGNDRSLG